MYNNLTCTVPKIIYYKFMKFILSDMLDITFHYNTKTIYIIGQIIESQVDLGTLLLLSGTSIPLEGLMNKLIN